MFIIGTLPEALGKLSVLTALDFGLNSVAGMLIIMIYMYYSNNIDLS